MNGATNCKPPSDTKTQPSGARVPAAVRDPENTFVSLVNEIKELRYCPFDEYDRRACQLALRILNAEKMAYEHHCGGVR